MNKSFFRHVEKKTTLCNFTGKKLSVLSAKLGKHKNFLSFCKMKVWSSGENPPLYFESKKKTFEFKMVFRCCQRKKKQEKEYEKEMTSNL